MIIIVIAKMTWDSNTTYDNEVVEQKWYSQKNEIEESWILEKDESEDGCDCKSCSQYAMDGGDGFVIQAKILRE